MTRKAKVRVNVDNASHNLDSKLEDQDRQPSRDVAQADFAAEAHGFTAFEKAGQGSTYPGAGGEAEDRRAGPLARWWAALKKRLGFRAY